jgi:16S rRNA (uracil1498-N3)-methyltransferase
MATGEGRTLNRFFVAGAPLAAGHVATVDGLAPQLSSVLRLSEGDRIILLDGSGTEYEAQIQALSRHRATALVLSGHHCQAEPVTQLTLYQCSLKHEKFEWVLQKGTELGVSSFVPVISARSIVRPADALRRKYDRWQAIIREAAEQCGRGRVPVLAEPLAWPAAIESLAGAGYLAWEGPTATVPLGIAVNTALHPLTRSPAHLSLLIGPEGGISEDEANQARAHGWQLVTLGPRILRAETAAVTAVAIAMDHSDEL